MGAGSFEDRIIEGLQHQAPAIRPDGLLVTFLAGPDKSDPLNMRAVMVAEATVRGKPCAWIVECQNDGTQAVQGRLLQGMIAAITATPDQPRSRAEADKVLLT